MCQFIGGKPPSLYGAVSFRIATWYTHHTAALDKMSSCMLVSSHTMTMCCGLSRMLLALKWWNSTLQI